jgi:hypothetical protein
MTHILWTSAYNCTPLCATCAHILVEGTMCACGKQVPCFPLESGCDLKEPA